MSPDSIFYAMAGRSAVGGSRIFGATSEKKRAGLSPNERNYGLREGDCGHGRLILWSLEIVRFFSLLGIDKRLKTRMINKPCDSESGLEDKVGGFERACRKPGRKK